MRPAEIEDNIGNHHKYPSQRLLECIKKTSEQFEIKGDHAQKLISMEQATSLEELIKTYNNVLKILVISNYGKKKVPQNWYIVESWNVYNQSYVEDLRQCLNENILSWFERQESHTSEQCVKCIANLRKSRNAEDIQSLLLLTAGIKLTDDIDLSIIPRRKEFYKNQYYITTTIEDPYKFEAQKQRYEFFLKQMMIYGHISDVLDDAIVENINIDIEAIRTQCEIEIEEKKKKEELKEIEEKEKRKKEKINNVIKIIIFSIISILLIFGIMYIFEMIGGIIGLIIIIGFIGLIPKILLTGRI